MNEPLRQITEDPDLGIVLSDGCRLSARVWIPADAERHPVPAILEYLPYRKRDGTVERDCLTHPWFAARGYACLRVDMRGNGDSQGLMEDEYTAQELADAVEVIEWIAAQPWCSGRVGMMGISWGGFNSLQVAALRPPALKAIVTLCSSADRYAEDIHYKGGCLLNENLGWGATMLSYSSRPPDPAIVGDGWRAMWLERLGHQPLLPAVWLAHQTRDDYWKHGSVCEDYSAIEAATLAVGGWGDAYKNTVPALVDNLDAPAKGIIGPWVHKYPHFAVPEPRIGFLQEAARWWDRWLKDIDTGVEADPAMRAYVMDGVAPKSWYAERAGRWIAEASWPSADIANATWHLGADGRLTDVAQDIEVLVDSPLDTGLDGGEYCAIWLGPELPGDQRADDARSACFDSEPLAGPIDIVGAPVVTIRLSADQPVAQIAVRLCEVQRDGASTRITYGVLNLTHHQSRERPTPLTPGEPVEVRVELDHIAWRVAAGSRLRVAISSAYWPLIWPSPQRCALTLLRGSVDLPIRPLANGDEATFEGPDSAEPWQAGTLREPGHSRIIERDQASGRVVVRIEDDFGCQRDLDHGLETGSIGRETWAIHPGDPLSAGGETHWTQTLARGEWSVRTETFAAMTCDARNFRLTGRIEAYEGDELVFEKNFTETIARDHI